MGIPILPMGVMLSTDYHKLINAYSAVYLAVQIHCRKFAYDPTILFLDCENFEALKDYFYERESQLYFSRMRVEYDEYISVR